ncbi:UNC5C-like protein isoform X1 [Xenia sp. Carnegie-2017]|uniref:UNC5C-like protein isoform X1 n=1 Tax=Xenia sp. Carnegie-2017 TaxID=2897299 RepID=UPI001F03BC51|nr:UNC5C-like protein isoform X1 [Xenia sp. Carnegie-2017]
MISEMTIAFSTCQVHISKYVFFRYFKSCVIDHNGGTIILNDTGVKLIIPRGAINVGDSKTVYIDLLDNEKYKPKNLKDGESLLSHVVACGPRGFIFNLPVMLVLPHSVVKFDDDNMKEDFRVLCSHTSPCDPPDWKDVFNNKKETKNDDIFCSMGSSYFKLYVNHFSWYTISGKVKAKKFNVVAYRTFLHQPKEDFTVRLYLVPSLSGSLVAQKKIEIDEEKLKGALCDGTKLMIFYKKGGNLTIDVRDLTEGWKSSRGITQSQSYDTCRACETNALCTTFPFEQLFEQQPDRISCDFIIRQEKCKHDSSVAVNLSVTFEAERKRLQMSNQPKKQTENAQCYDSLFISYDLETKLKQKLDQNSPSLKNWKDLANHLGFNRNEIEHLASLQSHNPLVTSPTVLVLKEWQCNVGMSPVDALKHLKEIFEKMERKDLGDMIEMYLVNEFSNPSIPSYNHMTFFSLAKHRFQPITEDKAIETLPFLQACREIVPFFDILGPTAFAPVKSDINGNIEKLSKKYQEDTVKYKILQDMVRSEMDAGTKKAKKSSTDALLWLKRALSFILVFLEEVLTGEQDLTKCAKKAYESTLKKYHGWMVQSIFSLAMKAVPYRKDFIKKLGNGRDENDVLTEMRVFVNELKSTFDVITGFYSDSGLEDASKV